MFKYLFLAFVFTPLFSHAQERATFKSLKEDKEICKAFAEKSIQEIDGGVLLVRLNFRQRQIDYLNSHQDSSGANAARKKAMRENKKIAEAFSEKFDFCTVYFFKRTDSEHVRNQQFDSVTFYNLSFNEIDSSVLETDNYLIGEFGRIKDDTVYYYSDNVPDPLAENAESKTYYGGTKNGREAFVIMDRKFQQIRKPFPYFAGLEVFLSEGVRYKIALEKINLKLHDYSDSVDASRKKEPAKDPR